MPPQQDPTYIAEQINQRVNEAIPNIIAQINAGLNHNQQGRNQNDNAGAQGCSYKLFMSCRPKEFHGTEGAIGLIYWIESMEVVLHISKCAMRDQVEYASCMLQGRALTWWNNQVLTRSREAAYDLSWDDFKKLLLEEYCPKDVLQKLEAELWNHEMIGTDIDTYTARFHELARLVPHQVTPEEKRIDRYIWGLAPEIRGMVTSANPTTIQSAVVLANRLTNDWIRKGGVQRDNNKGKRKMEDHSGGKERKRREKKQRRTRNFGMAATKPDQYNGNRPKCDKCGYHHHGDCPICNKCNGQGHFTKYCQVKTKTKGRRSVCYKCGSPDHLKYACPKRDNKTAEETKIGEPHEEQL